MSKRLPLFLLEDMIGSGERIQSYTLGLSFDDFIGDSKTIDAVIRNFKL